MTHAVIIWSWHQLPGLGFFSSAEGQGSCKAWDGTGQVKTISTGEIGNFCYYQLLCTPRTNGTWAEELCSTRGKDEFLFTWCWGLFCTGCVVSFQIQKRILVGRKNQMRDSAAQNRGDHWVLGERSTLLSSSWLCHKLFFCFGKIL